MDSEWVVRSPAMKRLISLVEKVAVTDTSGSDPGRKWHW
jgi:hypothetical protein